MIVNIEQFVYFYAIMCISMILFNFACIGARNGNKKILEKKVKKMNNEIQKQLVRIENHQNVEEKHIDALIKKCGRISYLMAFHEVVMNELNSKTRKTYFNRIRIVFPTLAQKYNKKNTPQKAYFAYLMSIYQISRAEKKDFIIDFVLNNVTNSSTYLRENCLKVLYHFGNSENIVTAYKMISRCNLYHNHKLLSDGLLTFTGNKEELAHDLYEEFDKYPVETQIAIIDFINRSSDSYKAIFYQMLLENKEEKEVNLAMIRYFRTHHYSKAQDLLIHYVSKIEKNNWEYAVVATSALENYPTQKTKQALKKAICHSNWYIRNNAASSLINLDITDEEIESIINGKDRYAKEILTYQLKNSERGKDYARNVGNR